MWFRRASEAEQEVKAALEDAQARLQEAQQKGPEASRLSRIFREVRERNHLAEQVEDFILRGRG